MSSGKLADDFLSCLAGLITFLFYNTAWTLLSGFAGNALCTLVHLVRHDTYSHYGKQL